MRNSVIYDGIINAYRDKRGAGIPFPADKELKLVHAKLEKIELSRTLPKNALQSEVLKYQLREMFVDFQILVV